MSKTPVLFLIFNRPRETKLVFDAIKKYKPYELFIAADGPRNNIHGEREMCNESRKITEEINWKCNVHRLYRPKNLGCKSAVSGAISWFFNNVSEGIILEDDCLPNKAFFRYCSELLEKYKDDKRILIISGDNFQNNIKRGFGSYYFSKFIHVWGWATWKDRWKEYDVCMTDWPKIKKNKIIKFDSLLEKIYWQSIFDKTYANEINTWDYQLLYTSMKNHHLNITPNNNLVENIGIGKDATHTKSKHGLPKNESLSFPLRHAKFRRFIKADIYTEQKHYNISIPGMLISLFK